MEVTKTVKLIDVKSDNITDYKETSLLLVFPYCSGKCGKLCQNYNLIGRTELHKDYNIDSIVKYYQELHKGTHNAVVFAGLEPFDSFNDVLSLVNAFVNIDERIDIVIYTGYDFEYYMDNFEKELLQIFNSSKFENKKLIIKVGKYDDNLKLPWKSNTLGVELATKNQKVILYEGNNVYIEGVKNDS